MTTGDEPKVEPKVEPQPIVETPKVFTQEEVNAIAGRARLEERQKYGDYDDLKAQAAKADELERAQMSEMERLQRDYATEQRKNIDAEGRIAEAMITGEIKAMAGQKGIVDPGAAVVLLDRNGISYSDDTGVVGVVEALDQLLVTKPYLKGVAIAPSLNAANNNPAPIAVTLDADQKEAAKLLGLSEEDYTKGIISPTPG